MNDFAAMPKSVVVYCASSNHISEIYMTAADVLAEKLVEHQIQIIYGGGGSGLMGRLANKALSLNGQVLGIIPGFMKDIKWDHPEVADMEVVADMHERKRKFIEKSEAIIALPGGPGTFEELFEAITLKQLGQHVHPIVIININGYFNPLLELLNKAIQEKFMAQHHRNAWVVIENPADIISAIRNAPPWSKDAIHSAALL